MKLAYSISISGVYYTKQGEQVVGNYLQQLVYLKILTKIEHILNDVLWKFVPLRWITSTLNRLHLTWIYVGIF